MAIDSINPNVNNNINNVNNAQHGTLEKIATEEAINRYLSINSFGWVFVAVGIGLIVSGVPLIVNAFEKRLSVVFQPHRYSRTRDLFEDFSQVLSEVDQLILLDVYPAGEKHIKDADGRSLARSIRGRGKVDPVFVEELENLDEVVETVLQDGDIFLTLGAGSIGAWSANFLSQHSAQDLDDQKHGSDEK